MPFLVGIGLTVLLTVIVLKISKNSNSNTTHSKKMNFGPQYQIVSQLMTHIDNAIGEEFIKYEVVYKLRQETLKQLETSYQESPQDLIDFSNSINRQLWALKWVAHITYEEIGTGRHHLRDYLKPEGRILAQLNRACLQKAFDLRYIEETEYKQALKDLDDLIREVGTWA